MGVPTRSRVTPAVGSTMAMRRPASQLNSDDLPTLGRPTMATCGRDMARFLIEAGPRRTNQRVIVSPPPPGREGGPAVELFSDFSLLPGAARVKWGGLLRPLLC